MENVINTYIETLQVGRKQSYKNLTVYPLQSDISVPFDYLTMEEALADMMIDIEEISEGGSVPELKVLNMSPQMVLIIEGEMLEGAKQNRVVNTTILIQADSACIIPVSCVEQGRWGYSSRKFETAHYCMSPGLRSRKVHQVKQSLEREGSYRSNQGEIWDEISAKARRLKSESATMSMHEMYEKKAEAMRDITSHFRLNEKQAGAVFVINGEIVGMDCFGKPETYAKVHKKLIDSYALDAIDLARANVGKNIQKHDVEKFLDDIKTLKPEEHKAVQLGSDIRLESKALVGFVFGLEQNILHMSIFNKARETEEHHFAMERFSHRLRRRRR